MNVPHEIFHHVERSPLLLQGASEGFECDEKASILCLAPGYSTFDLPFMHQQNFIKIGGEADMKVFLEPYNLYIVSLGGVKSLPYLKTLQQYAQYACNK